MALCVTRTVLLLLFLVGLEKIIHQPFSFVNSFLTVPIFSVKSSVHYSLGNMIGIYSLVAVKIGYRSRNSQHPVVSSCGKAEILKSLFQFVNLEYGFLYLVFCYLCLLYS